MSIVIPVFLIAALLIPSIAISSYYERKRFAEFLTHLTNLNVDLNIELKTVELKFLPSDFPRLQGITKEGFELRIFIESTHKNKQLRIEIACPDAFDFNFSLREETALDKVGILFNEKDIVLKDALFDKRFFMISNNEKRFSELFADVALREPLLKHPELFEKGILIFENKTLQYQHYNPVFVVENYPKTLLLITWMQSLAFRLKEKKD